MFWLVNYKNVLVKEGSRNMRFFHLFFLFCPRLAYEATKINRANLRYQNNLKLYMENGCHAI